MLRNVSALTILFSAVKYLSVQIAFLRNRGAMKLVTFASLEEAEQVGFEKLGTALLP